MTTADRVIITSSPISPTNPDIIDNRSVNFVDEIKKYLINGVKANFATGYFYLNGFNLLKEDLQPLEEINILMGEETDRPTFNELKIGYDEKIDAISTELINDSEKLDENSEQFNNLIALKDFIKANKVHVKVYVTGDGTRFHSKLYVIHRNKKAETPYIGIIGSSNFTKPGIMGNTELNYVNKQQDVVLAFDRWFIERFSEAKEFNENLIRIIESSPAYKRYEAKKGVNDKDFISPFELYKLIIFEVLNEDISIAESALAEFQKLGVENAKEKIRKFNGVIISDSVGLGKSFIGGDLIKWFREENKRVLLIVPASIVDQWQDLLEKNGFTDEKPYFGLNIDGVGIRIVSDAKFSNQSEDEIQRDYGNYDVVLIDEAHRFRNNDPIRYKNIQKLKGKTFILLSATPLNNSVRDLKNIISIFTNQVTLWNEHLNFGAFDEYYKISKKIRQTSTPEKKDIESRENFSREISQILEEVMILRTRKVIKERYPHLEINGREIEFSIPKIYPVEYSLSKSYNPIYQNIDSFIANLQLPHLYVISESSGKTLEGLYKVLLLKRLESSIYAFLKSLNSIIESETALKKDINELGFDKVIQERRNDYKKIEKRVQEDADLASFIDDIVDDRKEKKLNEETVLKAIEMDIQNIRKFQEQFLAKIKRGDSEYDYDDNKIDRLHGILSKYSNEKILIFTQFQATAEYLYYHLKNTGNRYVEVVVGGETTASGRWVSYKEEGQIRQKSLSKRDYKVRLFSPKSYNFTLEPDEKEIDILISTDTLSEGVNLQDCSLIVNYDLPWNPTRIIQRVGRVDRIGNTNRITVFNFFPDEDIESLLNLLEKLQNKIKDIATIVGKENGILSGEEEINVKTIGEKIKEIRRFDDIIKLEDDAKNPIFNITGEDKDAIIRFKLRNQIHNWKLSKSDFREYANIPYSVVKNGKIGIFSLYRIYDKKDGHKFKDILLRFDPSNNSISEMNPLDLSIEPDQKGIAKSGVDTSIDLDSGLKQLQSAFDERLTAFKAGYIDVEMYRKLRIPKIQQKIVYRLSILQNQKSLDGELAKYKRPISELKRLYANIFLSQTEAVELNKLFDDKSVMSKEVDEFIRVLREFRRDVIQKNPDHQQFLRREQNIDYKQICWGAFV